MDNHGSSEVITNTRMCRLEGYNNDIIKVFRNVKGVNKITFFLWHRTKCKHKPNVKKKVLVLFSWREQLVAFRNLFSVHQTISIVRCDMSVLTLFTFLVNIHTYKAFEIQFTMFSLLHFFSVFSLYSNRKNPNCKRYDKEKK